MAITSKEFEKIQEIMEQSIHPVDERLKVVENTISKLVENTDQLVRIVQRHDHEWLILRKQHERIKSLLVGKGIAREEDLAVS